MDPKISIITLSVSDLDRSIRFYRDGLGLPQRSGFEGIAFFELKGTWLALYPHESLAKELNKEAAKYPDTSTPPRFTLAHNVRSKEEVDALLSKAQAAGAKVVKDPQDTEWGGYSGYFSDPDGFLWETAWNPHFSIE